MKLFCSQLKLPSNDPMGPQNLFWQASIGLGAVCAAAAQTTTAKAARCGPAHPVVGTHVEPDATIGSEHIHEIARLRHRSLSFRRSDGASDGACQHDSLVVLIEYSLSCNFVVWTASRSGFLMPSSGLVTGANQGASPPLLVSYRCWRD